MTPETITTILVALLGSGALTAVLTPLVNRRQNLTASEKSRVDGAKVLTEAAVQLLTPLQARVDEATRKVDALTSDLAAASVKVEVLTRDLTESRREVHLLTASVEQLIAVIRTAGLPVPPPPRPGPPQ